MAAEAAVVLWLDVLAADSPFAARLQAAAASIPHTLKRLTHPNQLIRGCSISAPIGTSTAAVQARSKVASVRHDREGRHHRRALLRPADAMVRATKHVRLTGEYLLYHFPGKPKAENEATAQGVAFGHAQSDLLHEFSLHVGPAL